MKWRSRRWVLLGGLLVALAGCEPELSERERFFGHAYELLRASYDALAAGAETQRDAVKRLCAAAGQHGEPLHREARDAFQALAQAWSRVEWLRLGPVLSEHRFERIFYWPDRGGRGRRQLLQLLASNLPEPFTAAELGEKSVALQGLPALEYLLYGEPSASLQPLQDTCRLAEAVSDQLAQQSRALASDWSTAGDLRAALSGADELIEEGRALAALLQAADQALKTAAELKIAVALGDSPASARPGLAPFATSGLTASMLAAGTAELRALFTGPFQALLPEGSRYQGEALLRELELSEAQFRALSEAGSWRELVVDERHRSRLSYVQQPLLGAHRQLAYTLMPALGLTQGFNSADGD
ncbi:MAG: imelysin family protein [Pseudomonadota bacterium]